MKNYVNDYTTTVQKYHKELSKYQPLTKVKERELIYRAKNNDFFARQEILKSNLRFVFNTALKFRNKGVPLEELIAEGNYGLVKAIDKFNEKEDVKFISYAVWWIKQAMQDCVKKNNLVCESEVKQDDLVISQIKSKVSEEEHLDVDEHENLVSDDYEVKSKELTKTQKYFVNKLLQKLGKREQFILKSYYGIDSSQMTLEDIALELHISKERVRQIREETLRYLRTEIMMMDNVSDLF